MERVRLIFLWLFVSAASLYGKGDPVEYLTRASDFSLFEENGKVGLKDAEGDVLIPASYDAIGWSNGKLSIVDKVVGYQSGGLWGLIHTSNRIVTPPEFMELKPGEGSFLVAQKTSTLSQRPSFGVITTSGKTVIPFSYDALHLSNMRAVVMSRLGTKYKFGLVDLSHRILIPIEFQSIYSLGSLRYAVENFDHKTAIFSDEGNQVTGFDIDSISSFKKDYAILYQDQKQGLIDRNGAVILRPAYGAVRLRDDGSIQVRATDEWFFLEGDNKLIRQVRADGLHALSPEHYLIQTAGKLQLANNELKPLHEDFLSSIGKFENGKALYRKASRTGVITTEGKVIIPPNYLQLEIDGQYYRACLDTGGKKRWVILDRDGKQISEKHYEYIGPFNGKFYPAKNRGFWGALNAGGTEIITCVHDSLMQESHGNVVVKFKAEYGVINLRENWIVTPQPNPLKLLNDEAYLEFSENTTFLKSFPAEIIYFSENPLEFEGAYIREQLSNGAYWIINMSGIIIDRSNQPLLAEKIFEESEGLRAILKDGKFGFIDHEGRLRIANRYEDARAFSDGLAAIRIRGKWGFIDHQESLVVQPVYEEVEDFHNGMAIVSNEGTQGLIDARGKVILPLRYDNIIRNDHGRFLLQQGQAFGLADASGAVLINPRYTEIVDAGNEYVIVQRDGKYGVLTLRGVSTVPMIYDGLTFDPHHKQFLALKKSRWETFRAGVK
jgi:hypothetical protein